MTAVVVPETLNGWKSYSNFNRLGQSGELDGPGLYMVPVLLSFARSRKDNFALPHEDKLYHRLKVKAITATWERTLDLVMRRSPALKKEDSLVWLLLALSEQNPGGIDGRLGFSIVRTGHLGLIPHFIGIPPVVIGEYSGPIEAVVKQMKVADYNGPIEAVVKQMKVNAYVGPAMVSV